MPIPLPSKPKIIKQQGNQAVFEIEGCYPGYGITLGNAFRRTLLSSLPGAAVTGVKIKDIQHEFSTIPHIQEDVIGIILNLKQIRFKTHGEGPFNISLKVKGEREVKASDLKLTSDIEVVNKDAHIATLTDKKAELEVEIEVSTGLGYVPVEQHKKEKLEIGMIAVDAVFTPIVRVNFEVSNMRVGERTDYNRLTLDIETDGSISPLEALTQAAKTLGEQFKIFDLSEQLATQQKKVKKAQKKKKPSAKKPARLAAVRVKRAKKTAKKTTKKSKKK